MLQSSRTFALASLLVPMPDPRVSVVIPTYQRRELVQQAIASALSQTYRDFEVIVIDDGSTDGTEEALAPLRPRIRYLRQENRGPSAARNVALEISRGEIIAPLDSDDLWLPNHLEIALAALDRFPGAVLATTCPDRHTRGNQRIEDAELLDPYPRLFAEPLVGFIHCWVIRREALIAIGGFDERLTAGEHYDMFMRLGLQGPFVTIRHKTAIRRATPDSLHESAGASDAYVKGFEITARAVLGELERTAARPELIGPARARVAFGQALRALHEHDDEAAHAALARACELFPRFSDVPDWVYTRLLFATAASAPAERLRKLATAAVLWPRREADTAMYLRCYAIALAIRTGRLETAAGLLRGWPWRATPGFARLIGPRLRRRVATWLYEQRHRVRT
jgi:Glycosyl transferase family 2